MVQRGGPAIMARRTRVNKARPILVKIRVSPELDGKLRRLAQSRDVSLSRLGYEALKALVEQGAAA